MVSTLAILTLGAALSIWQTGVYEREMVNSQIEVHGRGLVRGSTAFCIDNVLVYDYPKIRTYAEELVDPGSRVAFFVLTLSNGEEMVRVPDAPLAELAALPGVQCFEADVSLGGDSPSHGKVTIGISRSHYDELLRASLVRQSLQLAATFFAVAFLMSILLRRKVSRPLAQLDRSALALARGELDRPVRVDAEGEFARLAETFETMRQSLSRSYDELETKNARLMRADRMKTAFLTNISHELRTPLTAILGFGELLVDPDLPQVVQQSHVRRVLSNSEHLLALVNDLLDISKLESGDLLVECQPCSVRRLLADLQAFLGPRAAEKQLELRCEVTPEVPDTVRTDPQRLRQMLLHLVGNAIKFTPQGEVRVLAGGQRDARGALWLRIEVRDTGIGIEPEALSSLFAPFWQADISTSRRNGGTGVGLAICKRLCERLGGDIQATSAPGKGSTFVLRLPTTAEAPDASVAAGEAQEARPATAGARPAPVQVLTGRVLYAEDAPDNQRLVSSILRKAGLEVDIAENGRLAIERARQAVAEGKPYDLILMDIQMPELDGCAATRWLRSNGFALPIVALTAHAMESDRERCMAAGCTDYATKPIGRERLVSLVRNHLPASRRLGAPTSTN
ncbi:MAG: response regulator [Planctomycetes bacterium]|nr:response regulator [Planctomycetota bacterium]